MQNHNVRSDERLAPTNTHPNLADGALEPHPHPKPSGAAGHRICRAKRAWIT